MRTPPPPTAPGDRPLACPECGSTAIATSSKTVDAATYWNCTTCGEVWNVGRRQETSRHAYPRR